MNKKKIKLLCTIPRIGGGGAERFFLRFFHQLDREKFAPSALLVGRAGLETEVPDDVPIRFLEESDYYTVFSRLLGPLSHYYPIKRSLLENRPDAILCFGSLFSGTVALAANSIGFAGPVVIRQALHHSREIAQQSVISRAARSWYLRRSYRKAIRIIAISEGVAEDLQSVYGLKGRVTVIHNGLDSERIQELGSATLEDVPWLLPDRDKTTLVTVARLVPQKGSIYLLRAMALIEENIRLIIVGDGPDRSMLEKLTRDLGLEERVSFVGYDRNPYRYVARADAFVFSSLWEGFGNTLLEALALGAPIVATDCPSGPREILADGEFGLLVPAGDETALANGIQRMVDDDALHKHFATNGPKRAEQFSITNCVRAYENLIESLMNQ